jgi:hypothetical protein
VPSAQPPGFALCELPGRPTQCRRLLRASFRRSLSRADESSSASGPRDGAVETRAPGDLEAFRELPIQVSEHDPSESSYRKPAVCGDDGGGGNRTRVRDRPDQSVYKLRLPLRFARRPVGSRPIDGLAILWCRASGDWLSLGAEPVSDAATRATGRARSDALRYGLGSESECGVVLRTYVKSRLFNEANRGPRLAALPENRPRRNQVAPVCQFRNCSRRWPASWWARTSAVRSSKKNVDPFSSFGSTQMRPPMRSISSRQM